MAEPATIEIEIAFRHEFVLKGRGFKPRREHLKLNRGFSRLIIFQQARPGRTMQDAMAVQVTIYLNEADQWRRRPLHMEILNYLRKENVYAATAIRAVAGFLGRNRVETSHLVEAGGKMPVIIIFVDTDEHVSRVLPTLKEMAANRLIVRENVILEQGNLD
jgi:PII-like signaling protein